MDIEKIKILTVKFLDTVPEQVFVTYSNDTVKIMYKEYWDQLDKGDEDYDII